MALKGLMSWLLLVLLWDCSVSAKRHRKRCQINPCLTENKTLVIVSGNYTGIMNATQSGTCVNSHDLCSISFDTSANLQKHCKSAGLWLKKHSDSYLLYVSKKRLGPSLCVILGKHCNETMNSIRSNITDFTAETQPSQHTGSSDNCKVTCLNTRTQCEKANYDNTSCSIDGLFNPKSKNKDKYIINITASVDCMNCDNPVKVAAEDISAAQLFGAEGGGDIDPVQAAKAMEDLSSLVSQMNESSASVSMGSVTGVLVKQDDRKDIHEVNLGFSSSNSEMNIVDNSDELTVFARSVSIPKEAFEMAYNSVNGTTFAGVFRFPNMATHEVRRTVLHNEVLSIGMGAMLMNLSDKIKICYRNVNKREAVPSCHSWNGKGKWPNWTADGCQTFEDGDNITCQCTHLTFFAVLMSPPNTTISSVDLSSLTYITQVGCGLSLFFLAVGLLMHCLMRRTKASQATQILINLFMAMFMLNLCFLVNQSVSGLKSHVGCQIMAGCMHYFMLSTFTWFAVEAFHLCLQLYLAGKVTINRYVLKVCIAGWVLPGVVVVVTGSLGKYGQQVIHTDSNKEVFMCWITDVEVHYIVNVGYYALVFLFTFTTFIVMVHWLYLIKSTKTVANQNGTSSKDIVTILGLCLMLGITWGFAFMAYGDLAVPSYYVFTILNSFQGFFLFLYYYNTSQIVGESSNLKERSSSSSNTTSNTINTTVNSYENPYSNPAVPKPGN